MNKSKFPNSKQVSIAIVLVCVSLIAGALIAQALTPSTTFWISPGVYPGAPSYTVWNEGLNYFAKNSFGHIVYEDTNITALANTVFSSGITGTIKFIGTFYLNGAFLPSDNQTLDLYDASLVQTHIGASFVDLIDIASVSNVAIYGGTLNGNDGANVQGNGINIFQSGIVNGYDLVENITVKDVTIKDVYYTGIVLLNASYCHIIDNFVFSSGNPTDYLGPGIRLDHYSNHNTIKGNTVRDSEEHGIKLYENCTDNIIDSNLVDNTEKTGITIDGTRNIIADNIIINANWTSIYTYGNYNVISNNMIKNSNPHGKEDPAIAAYSNNVIEGNEIYTGYSGIEVVSNCTVSGNQIYNITYNALLIYGDSNSIGLNNIYGIKASSRGAYVDTGATATIIIGDTYLNCYRGIEEVGSTDYNVYQAINTRDCTEGILTLGANTKVNLCWNVTDWIT